LTRKPSPSICYGISQIDNKNYEYIHNEYKFYYDLSETLYKVYRPLDIFPTDTVREISKLSIF